MSVGRFKIFITIFILLLGLKAGNADADNVVYLSSLEWPPYVGKRLPENGSSAEIVRKAFAAMVMTENIVFAMEKVHAYG